MGRLARPGAEYDLNPQQVEMQARLIASAPSWRPSRMDWWNGHANRGEDMPNTLVELAHTAQDILAHVKGQG